jgi:trehalose synthase
MADGVGGELVDSVDECAAMVVSLLQDRQRAAALAARGRERVREHFLLPRLVLNDLSLMRDLSSVRPISRPSDWSHHDPVCGIALPAGTPSLSVTVGSKIYGFCSERCRVLFEEAPSRYVASMAPAPLLH